MSAGAAAAFRAAADKVLASINEGLTKCQNQRFFNV